MKRFLIFAFSILTLTLSAQPTILRSVMEQSNMVVAPRFFWPTQVFSVSFSNAVNAVVTNHGSSTGGVAVLAGTNILITTNSGLATISATIGTNSLYWRTNNNGSITNTGGNVIVQGGSLSVSNHTAFQQSGSATIADGLLTIGGGAVSIVSNGTQTAHSFVNDGSAYIGGGSTDYKVKFATNGVVTVTNLSGTGQRLVQVNSNGQFSAVLATNAIGSGGGTGTVTSVGFTPPTGLTVSGSPVVGSGTIALSAPGLIVTNGETESIIVSNAWLFKDGGAGLVVVSNGAVTAGGTVHGNFGTFDTGAEASYLKSTSLADNTVVYITPGTKILTNIINGGSNTVLIGTSPPRFSSIQTLAITNINNLTWQTNVTELKYNINAFGAVGDGLIATNVTVNSGSSTLTAIGGNFVSNDVGKVISIYGGAGGNGQNLTTTIASFTDSNTISLTIPAVATATNVSCVHGSDDTTAIQLAMDIVSTNGGGTILFPSGIYIVNGPLRDLGTNRLHHNAQLFFPSIPRNGNLGPTVAFEGVLPIPWFIGLNAVSSNEFSSFGSCLWSTLPSGPDVNPGRVIDCRDFLNPNAVGYCGNDEILPLGNLNVKVNKMIWRSAFDNNLTLLDLQSADGSLVDEVIVDTGYYQGSHMPAVTHTNSWGFKTAGSFNANMSYVNNVMVRGFYNALAVGENSTIPNVHVEGSVNGICFSGLAGGTGMWIGHANIQECSNNIYAGPCSFEAQIDDLNIYNFERYTNNGNLLYDPTASYWGRISYSFKGTDTSKMLPTQGLPLVGGRHAQISRVGADSFVEQEETTMISAAQNSMYFRRLYAYGDSFPSINFGTQTVAFADIPLWSIYVDGANNKINFNHIISGLNPFIIDGGDNVTLGVSGKTTTLSSGTASSIVRLDGSKNIGAVTVGTGLIFDGTTLSTSGSATVTNAITTVSSNGVAITTIATNLDFWPGNATTVYQTNRSGHADVRIDIGDIYWKTNTTDGITNFGGKVQFNTGDVTVNGGTFLVSTNAYIQQGGNSLFARGVLTATSGGLTVLSNGTATVAALFTDRSAVFGGGVLDYSMKLDTAGALTVTNLGGTGTRYVQADSTGKLTFGDGQTYGTFPSATNTLTLNNGYQLLTATSDCAVTNIAGLLAGKAMWSSLAVSNSAVTNITLRMTGNGRAIGQQTTNAMVIAAGKVGIFSALTMGTLMTNYCTAAQQ